MSNRNRLSRRSLLKAASFSALGSSLSGTSAAAAPELKGRDAAGMPQASGPFNILMVVTDQERFLTPDELPRGYHLPGHERLAERGTVFTNHQIASCVCTPSRAVIYTGQHIQNNGMFDNTNFPWSGSMSTEITTIGDLLRDQGYYTAYKGKWHLTEAFETANDLHNPNKLLTDEMEAYGFSDYMGIGDVIGHTQGGYLHDNVIASTSRSWLRGKGEELRSAGQPWFLAVNLVNPHDVMFYNTDLPGSNVQARNTMFRVNREPDYALYQQKWDVELPKTRSESFTEAGRPAAHLHFRDSNAAMLGKIPDEDRRWERLNNYYLNCLQDADRNLDSILTELDALGIADQTIVIFTSDHGELAGAHGLVGKGATAYREQNNVPFTIVHPAYKGNKRCRAVTSHVDIATTLISFSGGNSQAMERLPGKDVSALLEDPEAAPADALRDAALYNFNMFGFIDRDFIGNVGDYLAQGGSPAELPKQGYKPDLTNRGAIRSIFDGRYKFSRYFSPLEHHRPETMEALYSHNDVELFDLETDPLEVSNLAQDMRRNGELIESLNDKLNRIIAEEVGEDRGQMLPTGDDAQWTLATSIEDFRP